MTLSSTTSKTQHNGDGSTVTFPTNFVFWDADDLQVIHTSAAGVDTVWDRGTEYTVTGGNGLAGDVVVSTVPTDYTPASGEKLTIVSNLSDIQPTSLPDGGPFPSPVVELRFDQIVRLIQQRAEELTRSIKLKVTSALTMIEIPDPESGKFLRGNATNDGYENVDVVGQGSIGLPVSIANGGTAATTEAAARTNLGSTTVGDAVFTAASAAAARTATGSIGEVSEDTTPQLGGDLDVAGQSIVSTSDGNIPITPNGTGEVRPGKTNFQDAEVVRPKLTDYGETINAIGSIGGGTQDIDLTLGNIVTGTVDTSTTTFTFSNPPATGTAGSFTLILTNGGSQTVNWPASVDWAGGTAPTLTSSGVDVLTFITLDAGTIWYGFSSGLDMQ